MRWEDERYVRLYTTDDGDWAFWPWQSRALFPLLMRRCNRVGVVKVGRHGARALAELVRLPVEVVEPGLVGLIDDGCVTEPAPGVLFVRNFLPAQEATQTDRARKSAQRERDRAVLDAAEDGLEIVTKRDASVTKRDGESQDVTPGHEMGQKVTDGHEESHAVTPCRAVPCRAVPLKTPGINSAGDFLTEPEAAPPAKKRGRPATSMPFSVAAAMDALRATGGVIVDPFPKEPKFPANLSKLIRAYPSLDDWRSVGAWTAAGGDGWCGGWRGEIRPDLRVLIANFGGWIQQAKAAPIVAPSGMTPEREREIMAAHNARAAARAEANVVD